MASPAEADLGLIYGLGFPPFLGGALKYIDDTGISEFVDLCKQFEHLGALYQPTEKLLGMSETNSTFYAQ